MAHNRFVLVELALTLIRVLRGLEFNPVSDGRTRFVCLAAVYDGAQRVLFFYGLTIWDCHYFLPCVLGGL